MFSKEFKLNKLTGSILLGFVFIASVLSTTACSPQFNRKTAAEVTEAAADATEALTPVQLLDGHSQGSMAAEQSTASFKLSKVSIGGSYQKAPSAGTTPTFHMHGGMNNGL